PAVLSTLSLHDALPISEALHAAVPGGSAERAGGGPHRVRHGCGKADQSDRGDRACETGRLESAPAPDLRSRGEEGGRPGGSAPQDRKSTRLNSSHVPIS